MNKIHLSSVKTSAIALKEAIRAFIVRLWMRNVKSDCYSISVLDYWKVICYDRFKLLKKTSLYTPSFIIMEGYAKILHHYTELSTIPEVRINDEKKLKYERLSFKYLCVLACYKGLLCKKSNIFSEYLVQSFICSENDDLNSQLGKCIAQLNGLKYDLSALEIKDKKAKKLTMADCEREMQVLKSEGYDVNRKMPLSEYIMAQNLFRERVEAKKRQIEEQKNGRTRNN